MATPQEIDVIPDPAERARQAQEYLNRGQESLARVRQIRDAAIVEWCKSERQRVVAEQLHVTPGLIGQIVSSEQRMPR